MNKMIRYDYIDGLRGLAIAGVVLIHTGQYYPNLPEAAARFAAYGLRGVSLFFIVSAFTLCLANFGRTFEPGAFYIKRFLRIAPMFYLAILAYSTVYAFGVTDFAPGGMTAADIVLSVLLLHGFSPSSINTVVPGGWSIASEVLFYLLFPLFVLIASNVWRAALLTAATFIVAVVSRPLIASALQAHYSPETVGTFIHFGFLNNLPAFASGILIYHLVKLEKVRATMTPYANFSLYFALAVLCLIGLFGPDKLRQPIAGVPFLALLVLASHYASSTLFDNKIMRHLGVVSFSVYLIHFLVLHTLFRLTPGLSDSVYLSPAVFLFVLCLTAGLATITYKFVEEPFINFAKRLAKTNFGRKHETRSES